MFGEDDIIEGCKRTYSVACSDQNGGELLCWDKKIFIERVMSM